LKHKNHFGFGTIHYLKNIHMKKSFLLAFAFLFVSVAFAQRNNSYSQGDKLLNVGIGLNSYYSGGIPFGASLEFGVTETISVGANVDYLSYTYNYGALGNYKFTALYFGGRGSYHFNELFNLNNEKVDLYGGATLGYRSFSWKDSFSSTSIGDSYGSGVYLGIFVGGKYYFSDNVGGFAELGAIGSTNVRIGLAFRF
jgi:hypothetical protein